MKENSLKHSSKKSLDLYEEKNPINDDLDSKSVISDITEFETMTEPDFQSLPHDEYSMASASFDSQPLIPDEYSMGSTSSDLLSTGTSHEDSSSKPKRKKKKRARTFDQSLEPSNHTIAALNLAGIKPTMAKDVEQILEIRLLVKFYIHRELSQVHQSSREARLDAILTALRANNGSQIQAELSEYLNDHNEAAGQGNILSSIIFISYKAKNGEEKTIPYKLTDTYNNYNFLSCENETFKELIRQAHATDHHSPLHDFHTEAALMVALIDDYQNIKDKFGEDITRISICINSRLSGCNRCVEKIQSVRKGLLEDSSTSSDAFFSDSIRCSVAFNSSRKFAGAMGRVLHSHQEEESAVKKPRSHSPFSSILSPIHTGDSSSSRQRLTDPKRTPNSKDWIEKIILNSNEFLSGSMEAKENECVIQFLNELNNKRSIDELILRVIKDLFPDMQQKNIDPRHHYDPDVYFVDMITGQRSDSSGLASPYSK